MILLWGALGAVTRFGAEYLVRQRHPAQRPWATVAANVVGCFVAGLVSARWSLNAPGGRDLVTGFCGGLTTFSSAFAVPATLFRDGHRTRAVAFVVTTPLLASALFFSGLALGGTPT